MEHLKKNLKRLEQRTAQSVGRAEKTDVLAEVDGLESRVERMLSALQLTKAKLVESLRTKGGGENFEKRRRKTEEAALVSALSAQSAALLGSESSLLGDVMGLYGNGLGEILDELVKTERDIEERALPRLGKFSKDEAAIKVLKEKLSRAVLDMDSAKRRLQANKEPDKTEHIQDEYDAAEAKVENCKDNLIVELHGLSGKEVEMAQVFSVIVEIQLEYFRTAAATLEGLLPLIAQKVATYPRRPVYGCPLEDHLRYSARDTALVLEVCCCALLDLGLNEEGLFRVSGNALKVRKLKAALDAGEINLSDYDKDPHSIAGAMKSYLRELPDPLMTFNLHGEWKAAAAKEGEARIAAMQRCLSLLPQANRDNLRYLIKFLAMVMERQAETKMTASNIAIVFGPNLLWMGEDQGDSFLGSRIVETLLNHVDVFFPKEVRYESKLIGSLHDRSGGFALHGGPIVSAYPRASPPSRASQSPSSYRALDRHPAAQKRPKAPAPPPPPTGTRPRTQEPSPPVSLYPNPNVHPVPPPDTMADLYASGPPSKSSSAGDSLNEYGAEEAEAAEPSTISSGYASSSRSRKPLGAESLEDIRKVDEAALAAARMTQSLVQTQPLGTAPSLPPPPTNTASAGHRKTASLDPGRAGEMVQTGSLNRGAGTNRFPNEHELDGLLLTSSVEVHSGGDHHPARPPPPSKESVEKLAALRSSFRSDNGRTEDLRHRHSLVLDVSERPKHPPEPIPRKTLGKPTALGFPPARVSPGDGAATIRISVEDGATSPDSSSKPKPPLPAKPKLDPEMTHL